MQMKIEKKIKANCHSCEFNFHGICAGHGRIAEIHDTYDMPIKSTLALFPKGCGDYGISFDAFIKQEKLNGR